MPFNSAQDWHHLATAELTRLANEWGASPDRDPWQYLSVLRALSERDRQWAGPLQQAEGAWLSDALAAIAERPVTGQGVLHALIASNGSWSTPIPATVRSAIDDLLGSQALADHLCQINRPLLDALVAAQASQDTGRVSALAAEFRSFWTASGARTPLPPPVDDAVAWIAARRRGQTRIARRLLVVAAGVLLVVAAAGAGWWWMDAAHDAALARGAAGLRTAYDSRNYDAWKTVITALGNDQPRVLQELPGHPVHGAFFVEGAAWAAKQQTRRTQVLAELARISALKDDDLTPRHLEQVMALSPAPGEGAPGAEERAGATAAMLRIQRVLTERKAQAIEAQKRQAALLNGRIERLGQAVAATDPAGLVDLGRQAAVLRKDLDQERQKVDDSDGPLDECHQHLQRIERLIEERSQSTRKAQLALAALLATGRDPAQAVGHMRRFVREFPAAPESTAFNSQLQNASALLALADWAKRTDGISGWERSAGPDPDDVRAATTAHRSAYKDNAICQAADDLCAWNERQNGRSGSLRLAVERLLLDSGLDGLGQVRLGDQTVMVRLGQERLRRMIMGPNTVFTLVAVTRSGKGLGPNKERIIRVPGDIPNENPEPLPASTLVKRQLAHVAARDFDGARDGYRLAQEWATERGIEPLIACQMAGGLLTAAKQAHGDLVSDKIAAWATAAINVTTEPLWLDEEGPVLQRLRTKARDLLASMPALEPTIQAVAQRQRDLAASARPLQPIGFVTATGDLPALDAGITGDLFLVDGPKGTPQRIGAITAGRVGPLTPTPQPWALLWIRRTEVK